MITLDENLINRLKVKFYEHWDPESYRYMVLEMHTGAIYYSNDLDCNGNAYFSHKTFLKTISNWDKANEKA